MQADNVALWRTIPDEVVAESTQSYQQVLLIPQKDILGHDAQAAKPLLTSIPVAQTVVDVILRHSQVAWGIRICAAARACFSMPATAPTGAPASTATCLTNPAHRISTRGSVCLGIR